ncbi:MAG: type II toxin-antitoxin system HigB family toxin [Thermoleophilia bacterium]
MRVIAKPILREFWTKHPQAEVRLKAWYQEAAAADWAEPADIKAEYPLAGIIEGSRVVFNIGGNRYRLVVVVRYEYRLVYIRFIGTHAEYDAIDAAEV